MHPRLQHPKMAVSALLLAVPLLAGAQSLRAPVDGLGGATWKARIEVDARPQFNNPQLGLGGAFIAQQPATQSLYLYGDYQFSNWRLGNGGGLRLTSGIIFSARTLTVSYIDNDVATASPYAGIGYSMAGANATWGWSADLGFTANGIGALRLDRLLSGSANLSTDGNLRLSPQLRLGMRLQF